jgi:hypothetical protein
MKISSQNCKSSEPTIKMQKMGKGGLIIISPIAMHQIQYLLYRYPNNEWSGILIYRIIRGDLNDMVQLTFYVEYVFLKDIGSGGYTEFDNDGDTMRLFDEFPEAMEMRMGMIHSHHTMGTGFSGTDDDELKINSSQHLYYLSMIVSHYPSYSAKLVFKAKQVITTEFSFKNKDEDDVVKHSNGEEEIMLVYDVPVCLQLDEEMETRIKFVSDIVKTRADSRKLAPTTQWTNPSFREGRSWQTDSKFVNTIPIKDDEELAANIAAFKNIPRSTADKCLRLLLTLDPYQRLTEIYSIVNKLDAVTDEGMKEIEKYAEMVVDDFFDKLQNWDIVETLFDDLIGKGKNKIPLSELDRAMHFAITKGIEREFERQGAKLTGEIRLFLNKINLNFFSAMNKERRELKNEQNI